MYLKQAREGLTDWWRYFVILIIVVILNFIASMPIAIVSALKTLSGDANLKEFSTTFNPEALGISQNMGLFLIIAPLAIVFIGLVVAIKMLYNINWVKVFTSYSSFRWKNFLFSAFVWLLLLIIADFIYYLRYPETYVITFNKAEFIPLFLICLLFIPFQASWEELYFRGNLIQGFGLLTNSRLLALVFTSVLFGSVHIFNPEVDKYGTTNAMISYIGFGLLLGITVVMDGGLEMAFGLHIVNNFYSAVFVSYSGSVLNTPALISSNQCDSNYMVLSFLFAAILFVIIAAHFLKWKSFRWLLEPIRK